MNKNILIIINNAPNYRPYYVNLGEKLKEQGNNVFYALDSKLSDYLYSDAKITDKKFYFSNFFKANYNKCLHQQIDINVNISKLLYSDTERSYYYGIHKKTSQEYYEKLYNNLLNFFYEIFIEKDIDAVLYENVSNSFAYAAYEISKCLGKKYIGLAHSRLPYDVFEIHESIDVSEQYERSETNDKMTPFIKGLMVKYRAELKDKLPKPAYMKDNPTSSKISYLKHYLRFEKIFKLRRLISYCINERKEMKYAYQTLNPLKLSFSSVKMNFLRKLRMQFIFKYFVKHSENDSFYLYPLHYHPEASTSILSPEYADELSVIRKVALNLPKDIYLYVKEHPNAFGFNSLDFYKQLKMFPNVKIISHKEDTFDLMLKSEGVITLTSTLGYEALLYNKKVLCFGGVFYKKFTNCYSENESINFFQDDPKKSSDEIILNYFSNLHIGKLFKDDVTDAIIKHLSD